VEKSFIPGLTPGQTAGVAVDARHIYWTQGSAGTIGRGNLDGTGLEPEFITGAATPISVAVDGGHLYWSNYGSNKIGRSNLDGTGVEQGFISGASSPIGLAVDDSHIYWANFGAKSIGRANLDGTGGNEAFIELSAAPFGVAVDSLPHGDVAALACEPASVTLGISTTCTATVEDSGPFSSSSGPLAAVGSVGFSSAGNGAFAPAQICSLASSTLVGPAVCQLTYTPSAIGRQTLTAAYDGDSFHVNPATATTSLTVKPQNDFKLGKPKLNRHAGGATLVATLPGPGSLALEGKGIKSKKVKVAKAGTAKLLVKPTGTLLAKLKDAGKAKAKLRVTFVPAGGDPKTKTLALRLVRAG
jgi:hypothetical protein